MADLKTDKLVKSYLLDFGLTENEIEVYIALLKMGPSTVMNIARKTGIKRSTCHNYVEELIAKGMASQTHYGERRLVIAEQPEKLKFLVEQRKWEVSKLEKNMIEIINGINSMIPSNKEKGVSVKYYSGEREAFYVYQLSMKSDEVYSFSDLERYYSVYPGTMDLWVKALENNKKRVVWEILVDNEEGRKVVANSNYERYKVKFFPKQKTFELINFADYFVFDNMVGIVQLDRDSTVGVLIDSPIISSSLKLLHKVVWDLI
ncbi:TrmB family transcriptional regulator [Candidatus Dojkabacteria bacterium]|uniref:TrmB family transcriptional regulator n=1 Tax=Candidatus Dojkabacteria bacterium TaxID=2099670 RepID=A0A3M0YZY8_9BACT|nr:MAG: TrmB family transcriptional regulator [Candidatus Dojkabacteria bacterium]